jgi:hypothetical protein
MAHILSKTALFLTAISLSQGALALAPKCSKVLTSSASSQQAPQEQKSEKKLVDPAMTRLEQLAEEYAQKRLDDQLNETKSTARKLEADLRRYQDKIAEWIAQHGNGLRQTETQVIAFNHKIHTLIGQTNVNRVIQVLEGLYARTEMAFKEILTLEGLLKGDPDNSQLQISLQHYKKIFAANKLLYTTTWRLLEIIEKNDRLGSFALMFQGIGDRLAFDISGVVKTPEPDPLTQINTNPYGNSTYGVDQTQTQPVPPKYKDLGYAPIATAIRRALDLDNPGKPSIEDMDALFKRPDIQFLAIARDVKEEKDTFQISKDYNLMALTRVENTILNLHYLPITKYFFKNYMTQLALRRHLPSIAEFMLLEGSIERKVEKLRSLFASDPGFLLLFVKITEFSDLWVDMVAHVGKRAESEAQNEQWGKTLRLMQEEFKRNELRANAPQPAIPDPVVQPTPPTDSGNPVVDVTKSAMQSVLKNVIGDGNMKNIYKQMKITEELLGKKFKDMGPYSHFYFTMLEAQRAAAKGGTAGSYFSLHEPKKQDTLNMAAIVAVPAGLAAIPTGIYSYPMAVEKVTDWIQLISKIF